MAGLLPVSAPAGETSPDLTAMVRAAAQEAWPPGKVPAGSGFFVSADGDIVTASHVIAGCKHVNLRDRARKMSASVVGVDTRIDAALLHARSHGHAFLTWARAVTTPDARLTLLTRSWTSGTASVVAVRSLESFDRSAQHGLIQLSGRVRAGASGAAIVNWHGEAEAYLIGRMADRHEVALAVPADELRRFLGYFTGARDPLRGTNDSDDAAKTRAPASKSIDAAVAVACAR